MEPEGRLPTMKPREPNGRADADADVGVPLARSTTRSREPLQPPRGDTGKTVRIITDLLREFDERAKKQ